jgi:hypothetical protein
MLILCTLCKVHIKLYAFCENRWAQKYKQRSKKIVVFTESLKDCSLYQSTKNLFNLTLHLMKFRYLKYKSAVMLNTVGESKKLTKFFIRLQLKM